MRLLVVSHSCVVPTNQDFFGRLRDLAGWDVDVILPERWRNEYGEHLARRSPQYGGGLHPVPVMVAGSVPLHVYRARLRSILRATNPDVVYVHHEPYALATIQWALAVRDRLPFGFYAAQNLYKDYPLPVRAAERLVHRCASFALPVSEEVAQVLRRRGYSGPIEVLPLSVDTTVPVPSIEHAASPPVVGYLGRLSHEKGVDTLLRACAKLRDVDYRCVIAGDGPAATDLRRLAHHLGIDESVEWTGYVDHARASETLSTMDVVAVPSRTTPSWKEQFGRVVVEALAVGVPVVTSNSGELPRLVDRTGGGWVFTEDDPDALAQLLREVLSHPDRRRRVGERGATYVRTHLAVDAIASRFARVVGDYAARSSPRTPRSRGSSDC